jgi:hypothetical protein
VWLASTRLSLIENNNNFEALNFLLREACLVTMSLVLPLLCFTSQRSALGADFTNEQRLASAQADATEHWAKSEEEKKKKTVHGAHKQ